RKGFHMAVKRCKTPFAFFTNGVPRVVREGDLVEDTDDAYRDHKSHFETVRASNVLRAAFERATAAPGEKRRLSPEE
ncbi:MAG: hypothetical protein ACREMY_32740, partial [bacterium]